MLQLLWKQIKKIISRLRSQFGALALKLTKVVVGVSIENDHDTEFLGSYDSAAAVTNDVYNWM